MSGVRIYAVIPPPEPPVYHAAVLADAAPQATYSSTVVVSFDVENTVDTSRFGLVVGSKEFGLDAVRGGENASLKVVGVKVDTGLVGTFPVSVVTHGVDGKTKASNARTVTLKARPL